jgi:tyrosyl-tRNA synthetase
MTTDAPRSDFLRIASERGFVHQCTDLAGLDARLSAGPVSAYVGYDCTADSLHVGHLISIMLLRLWQNTGNRPVVLLGGGTTRIGDPSFRDESRPLLTDAQIEANKRGIRGVFERFLAFGDSGPGAIEVDNASWLDELRYIPLLREVGVHFSVNRMLTLDSVKQRLEREHSLTFLEFNYMILQSYDFRELNRRHGVAVQMGGSDQWGNIVMGADLIRRMDGAEAYGLTVPLLTTASGQKMGKTASGAVWLNADRLAPFGYWQFWRNTEDPDVGKFLRLFTDLPMAEIARLEVLQGAELNAAKAVLATEATALLHGRAAAEEAAKAAAGDSAAGLPIVSVQIGPDGVPVWKLPVLAGVSASNSEARRLIQGGGLRLNDHPVVDINLVLTASDFPDGKLKLSAGKKRQFIMTIEVPAAG